MKDNQELRRACQAHLEASGYRVVAVDATGPQPKIKIKDGKGLNGMEHVIRPDVVTMAVPLMGCRVVWDVPA